MVNEINEVSVRTQGGDIPFSVGYLANALLAIGLPYDRANRDAYSIALTVSDQGKLNFTSDEIMEITTEWYQDRDENLASRLQSLRNDLKDLKPTIVLLGGVTGIGKSTIAQLFSARMGLKSIIGTDLIREVLRVTISSDLMPTLHTSSYIAHEKLDATYLPVLSKAIVGFEEQARTVIVGIEAAIEQAIIDKEILVIEGVHLVPGLIRTKVMKHKGIIPIQCILKDQDVHSSRLKRREGKTHSRGTSYYKYFEEIREIQDYLIEQAEKNEIKIIEIDDDEKSLVEIINYVWEHRLM